MRSSWKRDDIILKKPADGFRRFEILVSYDGTDFCGWQRQNCSVPSIQGEIERAVFSISGEFSTVYGSGRTDSGVHALAQVAHFDNSRLTLSADKLRLALNANLPRGIRIKSCIERFDAFHARFSTFLREYIYMLKCDEDFGPFDVNRVWNTRSRCSKDMLDAMARMLMGEDRDFAAFDFTAPEIEHSSYRDVLKSRFFYEKDVLCYQVVANAFLYHQVRAMVGTMVEFEKKYSSDCIAEFESFLSSHTRTRFVAPAYGLYLARIIYDESEYEKIRGEL